MMERFDCMIVGGGHGGAQAAIALRQAGFAGSIGLIGDEPVIPYDRPALSKEYLAGKKSFDRLQLRPPELWNEREVVLRLGRRVIALDSSAKVVVCDNDTAIGYGVLIWAAGGEPRPLSCPGHNLSGVHTIRNKGDCDRLLSALPTSQHIAVIGGGYIGLEAAAVLRELGKEVTLLEAQDRVLARVAAEPVSRFYEAEHRTHGVEILLGTGISELTARDGAVSGVRLQNGTAIAADQVIVGIGIMPAIGPLLAAGAEATRGETGILVDDFCRTTLPDVYCIGDCTIMRDGPGIRIESVQNANEQAQTAAKAVCGKPQPLRLVPWFWSNQYDLRLQTIGLSLGYDQTVLRGNLVDREFSLVYLKDGAVIALDCINATRDYVQGRKLVEAHAHVDPALLADDRIPLKDIAIAA
ncbi:FAD-dependent oxidoreductase [Phyllobacterium sp. YR531]|uniref:NAD(P)/FAD-dependent oxidoreductase n=1 Tax=Phyllobacterium sp. YR531 TaxID=1144343 RepID=UPI00026FC320|nr:FAD-dependent oxidoreductase [Phyllobacterium sp. YR531]EJN06817.1 NAD(P)H-nitrite reductase [Phyllobacterium sp. YR531]